MKITLLCSDALHQVNAYLQSWINVHEDQHQIDFVRSSDLIRICDPDRFPAYFELHGHKYNIRLEKA